MGRYDGTQRRENIVDAARMFFLPIAKQHLDLLTLQVFLTTAEITRNNRMHRRNAERGGGKQTLVQTVAVHAAQLCSPPVFTTP